MQHQEKNVHKAGMKPADMILVLYRRKWLILFFALLGIAGSVLYYFMAPATYVSEARLFIRYVLEKKMPGTGTDSQMREPDSSGKNIVASEVQVLTSYDLALDVADKIGPRKLVPAGEAGEPTRQQAASVVTKGIQIEVPRQSDVVKIAFQHPDPTVVQAALTQLIASYLKKHDEIHRASGVFDDVLTQQTYALKQQVSQTEQELRQMKLKTGISSLEETKKAYTTELSRIRQELDNTQAEMAERQAALAAMTGQAETNLAAGTNDAAPKPDPQIVSRHRTVTTQLESLRKREQELLGQFTPENTLVKDNERQIAECEKILQDLEAEHPGLMVKSVVTAASKPGEQAFDPEAERIRLTGLHAKLVTLEGLSSNVTVAIAAVHNAEPDLLKLQRKKEVEEDQYRRVMGSLEQARFDEALGAGRSSNIGVAQKPTPAFRESRETFKVVGLLLAAGVGLGIMLAFALEMIFKPTVRTVSELERHTRARVFISIPELAHETSNGHGKRRELEAKSQDKARNGSDPDEAARQHVVRWDPGSRLQVYYEGLRDRIMTWFDNHNLTRKPKLVAVTSCEHGAGVSSIAAGLAATLSETGDGRVLLVDMNVGQGAAHSFYQGRPGCGLDEVLERESRDGAQVNENLFVVAEGTSNRHKLPSVLPRRFTSLVPKLKASDFDYIIFDMPPVTPITITARLSAFMDMVLMVVEADKTSPHSLKQSTDLLTLSKANVGAVLNKANDTGPKWLESH